MEGVKGKEIENKSGVPVGWIETRKARRKLREAETRYGPSENYPRRVARQESARKRLNRWMFDEIVAPSAFDLPTTLSGGGGD